ncbi:LrgB family protein [Paenibacillus sp. MWE-103]|uniref:LrgB family protein n=1 Tax=Paenibacillus artemisiicola TaxID=1172618 RepID=A0ABS3WD18_9BACL|nr:LrgB family protein [Paenibacillus artemisiicola]MBO7746158.1 LrgB family protein [Paenibacillus artemisiicola]
MTTAIASFLATVLVYALANRLYRRRRILLLSPLIVTPASLALLLLATRTDFAAYNAGAHWLSDMLQPATVALAVPLARHFGLVKKHAAEIAAGVLSGSAAAVGSTLWLAKAMKLDPQLVNSLIPHSSTTPIAMNISQAIGGIPAVTAVAVMITGIFGSLIGPGVIRLLRIRSDVARGVLLGTSAHGAGTSKAFELSSVSGTVSSIAMILAAVVTLFIAPWLLTYFES